MQRRTFLQVSSAALGADLAAVADGPIPTSTLGRTGLRVSRIAVGGHHMSLGGVDNGVRVVQHAIDLGVTFFDSAHKYNNGLADEIYGKALTDGRRQKIVLMSKAHLRTRDDAMRQLEETLRRMRTDYLDLWQCHEVSTQQEVDTILGPGGALEAFVKAKQQGKARHIGFTGHHDPAVHRRLLESFDGWETVQHPVNLIDPHYLSFIHDVLPRVKARGLGRIGMKSNAIGAITKNRIATIDECLRFAWSQDIDTLISGVETVEQLEHNVLACKSFRRMTEGEITDLLTRTGRGPHGPEIEEYKRGRQGARLRPHRDGEPA